MAFQQGLSGLNAAAKNLDVIGHNIANANTTGFKSSRAEFADLMVASMGMSGGQNAGFGVEVAAVAQQFKQRSLSSTGNSLDVAINGGGFFQVQQPNGSMAYTRAGDFKMDQFGNLKTNGGAGVMGYQYKDEVVNGVTQRVLSAAAAPIALPTGTPIAAKATENIKLPMNLDARANDAVGVAAVAATLGPPPTPAKAAIPATPASTYGTAVTVYDAQGVSTSVNLYFLKNGPNTWEVYSDLAAAQADLDAATTAGPGTPLAPTASLGQLTFDANGNITGPVATAPKTGFELPIPANTINSSNPNTTPPPPKFATDLAVNLDGVTQFGSQFAVSDLSQDGYASGELTGVTIAQDGTVMASYSNGMSRAEAQVALANFRNPQGLIEIGGNNWIESPSSGSVVLGKPGSGQFGSLRSGALEDSNVDLTAELVGMITAQRAYQANAQTIKTQDQVMSTIVNLR